MISSPCKNCSRKNLPKDNCAKDCELIQAIQHTQTLVEQDCVSSGIDYTEEYSYIIPASLMRTSNLLWTSYSDPVLIEVKIRVEG